MTEGELYEAMRAVCIAAERAYSKPSVRTTNPELGAALARLQEATERPDENNDLT